MYIPPPNYTQAPNDLFDKWLPLLNESELKVLLVILRKTFGWQKKEDMISLSQLQKFTGLSETSVLGAVKSLIERNLISKKTIGEIGKQHSIYELVVQDSNNSYPPRCQGGPPQMPRGTPPDDVDTKETISKQTNTKEKQQHDAAAFPKIYECLESLDIPQKDKIEISQRNLEVTVKKAIAWAVHPQTKINKSLAAAIKWACENEPEVPKNAKDDVEENMSYAKRQEASYPNGMIVECLSKHIEIVCTQSAKAPTCIEYTEKGFKEQLNNALRKANIQPK